MLESRELYFLLTVNLSAQKFILMHKLITNPSREWDFFQHTSYTSCKNEFHILNKTIHEI